MRPIVFGVEGPGSRLPIEIMVIWGKRNNESILLVRGVYMDVFFEWDPQKASANLRKHGISFDEASTVFNDPLAAIFDDEDHSEGEIREIIIGHSIKNDLMVVCFTERAKGIVRIFSARLATRKERKDYEENRK